MSKPVSSPPVPASPVSLPEGGDFPFPEQMNEKLLEGMQLHKEGKLWEAVGAYANAILIPGEFPEQKAIAANNMGAVLFTLKHYREASQAFTLALSLDGDFPEALNNRGNAIALYGDHAGARESYEKALSIRPEMAEARMNCGIGKLLLGDMPGGWVDFEHRWSASDCTTLKLVTAKPRWSGQDLTGKRILIWSEQGLGDSIQFIRYASLLAKRGATVLHHGHKETVGLFAGVEGISKRSCEMDVNTIHPASYDYHCPLMSLPGAFGTKLGNIPAAVPYIRLSGTYGLPETANLKVALAWAGKPEHGRDRWRSTRLETMAPLLEVPGVSFFSVQVGEAADQVKAFPQISNLSYTLNSLQNTARVLKEMDLLIAVDTSVIHLAGALARPVWTLLAYNPCWRWMLETSDTPWYPTMRLYRQDKLDDWEPVLKRAAYDLRGLSDQRLRALKGI